MTPVKFPEAMCVYGAPSDLDESQVMSMPAYRGVVGPGSSVDGAKQIVVAWSPLPEEIELIAQGKPIFISFLSDGLPPHFPSMSFHEATHPK